MGRQATGTVDFRGNPPRWWARVTVRGEDGKKHRPWVDLERPDLKDTPEDKAIAKRLARKRAKLAKSKSFLGRELATGSTFKLGDLEDKWHALGLAMTHYGTIFESAAVLYTNILNNGWQ